MNSNAKSSTGQGGRFTPRPKAKQPPHLGLHILTRDGKNVTVWKDSLCAYAEANFHSVGRAFADGKRLIRDMPTLASIKKEVGNELHQEQLQVMLQQEITQLIKMKRKDQDDESSLFALIGQVTTEEGMSRVKNREGYCDVADERKNHYI